MERQVGQPEGRAIQGRFVKTSEISGARIGLGTRNSEFWPMLPVKRAGKAGMVIRCQRWRRHIGNVGFIRRLSWQR
jgi:hypothetical protein